MGVTQPAGVEASPRVGAGDAASSQQAHVESLLGGDGDTAAVAPSGVGIAQVGASADAHADDDADGASEGLEPPLDEAAMSADELSEFLSPLEALSAMQDHQAWRRRLVRNRWQLFWMLHKHPVLQA